MGLIFIQIFFIFTEWGFSIFAIDSIANNTNDKDISNIISSVYFMKAIFAIISLLLFFIIFSIDYLSISTPVYIGVSLAIFFGSFNSIWFYQAINNVRFYLWVTFFARIIFLLLIFLLVNNSVDYFKVIYIQALFFAILTIFSFLDIHLNHYKFCLPSPKYLPYLFNKTKGFFFASLIQNQFHILWGTILIFLSSPIQVGLFNIADQILKAGSAITNIIPEYLLVLLKKKQITLSLKIFMPFFFLYFCFLLIGINVGPKIIITFFGNEYINSIGIILLSLFSWFALSCYKLIGYPFIGILRGYNYVNRIAYKFLCIQLCAIIFWVSFFKIDAFNLAIFFFIANLFNLIYGIYIILKTRVH